MLIKSPTLPPIKMAPETRAKPTTTPRRVAISIY
jgi:hypothetical protein